VAVFAMVGFSAAVRHMTDRLKAFSVVKIHTVAVLLPMWFAGRRTQGSKWSVLVFGSESWMVSKML
jgi:hypothetical protein